jgi:uncharacterized protein (DUF1684 family)
MLHTVKTAAKLVLACLLFTAGAVAADDAYIAEIQKWRHDFEVDVRTGGWLTLAGRFKIDEGTWTVGGDSSSRVVLPGGAPKHLGTLTRHGRRISFEAAPSAHVKMDGKALSGSTELSTKSGKGRLSDGDFGLVVRPVGDDLYLFVDDKHNPGVREFKGLAWFAVDPAYRVSAKFEPYEKP